MIGLMLFNLLIKLIIIIMENLYRVRMIWTRYFKPYWDKHIKPRLKCCTVCWNKLKDACCKYCKKPKKVEQEEPKNDLLLTDPRGFSSNYLIIQQLNGARSRLSRRERMKKEAEERRRQQGESSSSGEDESAEEEKEEPRAETEEPLAEKSKAQPLLNVAKVEIPVKARKKSG